MSETIYLSGYWSSRKYHTDPDCPQLKRAKNTIESEKSKHPDVELCSVCDEGVDCMIEGQRKYKESDCPYCGETVKKLPNHLPCDGL